MANLRDIKKRVKSVKKTQKLTSAMKMVASARLRRIEPRLESAREYNESVGDALARIFLEYSLPPGEFPLVQDRGTSLSVGLIVLSGERGLCGAYNANVINAAMRFISERPNTKVVAIGKKGTAFFQKHGVEMMYSRSEVLDHIDYRQTQRILKFIVEKYLSGEVDQWHVLYHRFVSMMSQQIILERLIPMQLPEPRPKTALEFKTEPDNEPLLRKIIPQKLSAGFYEAVMDSVASEQGARRNAMEAASDNAMEMIERLTLLYNRLRQAAITTEILEVVAGAEP